LLEDIKSETKRFWDLTFIVVLSLLLAPFIYLIPDDPMRILIGVPFIVFFPGYALTTILFPGKESLDTIERIALTFGLSIAAVPLIVFGLNFMPFGIRMEPILWSLIVFNITFSLLGMWRRSISDQPFMPFRLGGIMTPIREKMQGKQKLDRLLIVVMVIAILSSVVSLAYISAVPREGERFSEFYVLGPNGTAMATDYPHNLTVGQGAEVVLGISNHEHHTVNHTVEVWLANITYPNSITEVHQLIFIDEFSVVLGDVPADTKNNWSSEWQSPYNFTVTQPGAYKIWFILSLDGSPFQGVKGQDYTGTSTQDRFQNMVDSKSVYSLNLNLNVTA
jgi:uncharacterized membrane protein